MIKLSVRCHVVQFNALINISTSNIRTGVIPLTSHELPLQSFHPFSFSNYGHLSWSISRPSGQKGRANHLRKFPCQESTWIIEGRSLTRRLLNVYMSNSISTKWSIKVDEIQPSTRRDYGLNPSPPCILISPFPSLNNSLELHPVSCSHNKSRSTICLSFPKNHSNAEVACVTHLSIEFHFGPLKLF